MTSYNELHEEGSNFSIDFPPTQSSEIEGPPNGDVAITIEDDSPYPETTTPNATTLLHRYTRLYFFLAGQWFWPAEKLITKNNLPRKLCRIAYAIWQLIVVLIMWSYFLYSMGFFTLRTIEEVDWLCPLTDIKNMAHGLCWIVNHHTGLLFFLFGKFERLLKQLSITKDDVSFPGTGKWGGGGREESGKKKGMAWGAFLGKCKLCFTTELF